MALPDGSENPGPMTRSKTFQAYLPSCHRTYSCIHCRAHLANHDELISKVGKHWGRALRHRVGLLGCPVLELDSVILMSPFQLLRDVRIS
uniref:Yippee domain-containing protein n=1 Tax=Taeniopygia guttata TaxID=59729 RepID=H0ZAX1_TAEGU